jgi:hypothetical protein
MEMYIFFAGLIMMLIVSSGLAISTLFLGNINSDYRVHYSLKDLTESDNLKKLMEELKEFKTKNVVGNKL